MQQYNPQDIEAKWQKYWEETELYKTPEDATSDDKYYMLPQLPYPSGSGLHVGHAEVYNACDIFARYQRMKGEKVLQVIGWDSFGLPAENYAIKTNVHPRKSTDDAIDNFREQIKKLGISVDWDREVGSHNPDYYKWTQWFFQLFYKRGLAYRKKQAINWCEEDKTVLANAQVLPDGTCERCGTKVVQREMDQWYIRITEYADKLLEGLDTLDWPEESKKRQRDWIGRSEGAEINFSVIAMGAKQSTEPDITVFTTRPDTIFGVTYMVLAPEHELILNLKSSISNWNEVEAYITKTAEKTELDRQIDAEKTGVELQGIKAVNPVNGEEIPVWIADYVLATYGTGAIMAVPAHDQRDFEFAKKFGLEVRQVVAPDIVLTGESAPRKDLETTWNRRAVDAIIESVDGGEFLLQVEGDHVHFVGGGTDGEELFVALKREITEETGYINFKVQEKIIDHVYCEAYRHTKNKNQHGDAAFFHVKLTNTEQVPSEVDEGKHELVWVKKEDVGSKLTWDHHKLVWDMYVNGNAYSGDGKMVNSDFLDGLNKTEAIGRVIEFLEEKEIGKKKVQYKLRDWSVSRQRFWGAPVPMLIDVESGETKPVPEEDLPVILPEDVDFKPTGESPLNYSPSFQEGVEEKYGDGWRREVDTLDTFMCSSWYYFRYIDPHNDKAFASPEALKKWMPVDFYLGGPEHVNGHLLYSRFFTKVLYDAGYIDFDEPFPVHRHQGLILAEDNRKMSKRWGNVINPTDVVNEFGADTIRTYQMFMGPLEDTKPWSTDGVRGVRKFLDRVWRLQEKVGESESEEVIKKLNEVLKKVTNDMEEMKFNTAIAKMMELSNVMTKADTVSKSSLETFVKMLAPFAPHMAEELWSTLGNEPSVTTQTWPTYDESMLVNEKMTIVVQINGKVRDKLDVAADASEEEIKTQALSTEKIKGWLDGNEPKKVIYVKGKLVSIVV